LIRSPDSAAALQSVVSGKVRNFLTTGQGRFTKISILAQMLSRVKLRLIANQTISLSILFCLCFGLQDFQLTNDTASLITLEEDYFCDDDVDDFASWSIVLGRGRPFSTRTTIPSPPRLIQSGRQSRIEKNTLALFSHSIQLASTHARDIPLAGCSFRI
jgi:hypothetical protein